VRYSYIRDVLEIWVLLQFGDTEIGFYKGGGEEKANATWEENNEPIPSHCLGKRMGRGKWHMKYFGVCNTLPAPL